MASTRALVLLALLALTAVAAARDVPSKPQKGPNMPQPMKLNTTKLNITKPTDNKPTFVKPTFDKKPNMTLPSFMKPNITKLNKTAMFDLLNKTEQLCLDKIFNWTSIKTLKPWEQCGGAGANCTAYGKESTHCLDAEFYDWICPDKYTCTRQDDNEFYYQCIPMNMTMDDDDMDMNMDTRMGMNNSSMFMDGFNKTIEWEKLPMKEQEEVSKCLGWPMPSKMLKPYEMCGGMAPQMCGKYGNSTEMCKDEKFADWECPMGEECVRQDKWFWQCKPVDA